MVMSVLLLTNMVVYTKSDERESYLQGIGLIFCTFGTYKMVNNKSFLDFLLGAVMCSGGIELIMDPASLIKEYDVLRQEGKKIKLKRKMRMYWDKVDDTLEISEKQSAVAQWFSQYF